MSARFCFKCHVNVFGHFTGTFKSTDGEEYAVRMECSYVTMYRRPRITATLAIGWKKHSNKFITASVISERSNTEIKKVTKFIDHQVNTRILWDSEEALLDSNIIVIIDVAPCIHEQPITKPAVEKPTKEEPVVGNELKQLSTDIKQFLTTGDFSDVVLTDGSNEIRAHKLILSARSSVFARMFQHPMKENRENRVTIEDVSHEVLLELLNFMYAGTVVIKDSRMARDLYVAADKYDVKDLRDICSTMLKSVNLNSVLDTLLLADLYSDQILKEAALNFISRNYSEIKATENWSSFMEEHPILAVEILRFVIDEKI